MLVHRGGGAFSIVDITFVIVELHFRVSLTFLKNHMLSLLGLGIRRKPDKIRALLFLC
jgi:hypothetical protein